MSNALLARSLPIAALALTAAALPASAMAHQPIATASAAGAASTVGTFTGDTATTQLANLDAASNAVIAVVAVPGEGWNKATVNSGRVWFSRLDDTPTQLDVDPVPVWGQPHWGTDAAGKRVAIYPRCAGGRVSDCDLYLWEADTNKERRLTEVDKPGVGEIEGTMERGAIAYTTQSSATSASAAKEPIVTRALWLKRVGKPAIKLTDKGGVQLALHSGVVAQEILVFPEGFEGEHQVQLVRSGKPTRLVLKFGGGMNSRHTVGMRFFGNELRFGIASYDDDLLYRASISGTAKPRKQKATFQFSALAWADVDSLAYVGDEGDGDQIKLLTREAPSSSN